MKAPNRLLNVKHLMRPSATALLTVVLLVAALLAVSALSGCTIKQRIQLSTDGSGAVSMHIRLQPLFVQYLNDLSDLTGEPLDGQVFKVKEIEKGFAARDDVELTRVEAPSPDSLDMEFRFRSVEKVFSSEQKLQEAGIVRFAKVPEGHSLRFHLDRTNFQAVMQFMPFLQNPLFEGLGPQENDDTTEAEYLELMDLALGEGGAQAVKDSYIETTIVVKGKLISQSGGETIPGGVVFRIPLIRVLLLDRPLDYELVFR